MEPIIQLFVILFLILLIIPFLPFLHELIRIPLGAITSLSGRYGYIWFHILWFMRPEYAFDTTLDKLSQKKDIKIMKLEKLIPTLQTGDLLFDISRNRPLGVYCGLKWGYNSVVTHAALVKIEQGEPWVIEAVTEGVRYIPLRESIKLYNADIVFIRRLEGNRPPNFDDIVLQYFQHHINDPHKVTNKKGMMEMISAAIDPKLPFTKKEIMVNHRNQDGLFCSELVAELLMEEDILPDDIEDNFPDANEYVPPDFTSFCSKKNNQEYQILHTKLKHGYYLGEEVFIDFNQNELLRKDNSIYQWLK